MRRRPAELYSGDWVDVYCAVCHRPIYDGEWRDEDEYGTMCQDCHERARQGDDSPRPFRHHFRRTQMPLDV